MEELWSKLFNPLKGPPKKNGELHIMHTIFLYTWPPPHNHEWILERTLFDKDKRGK